MSRKRTPVWVLLIAAVGFTAVTLWLALAAPIVVGRMCDGSWAEVFAEANNFGAQTVKDQCREAAHIRFGISVLTGVVALSATTRLLARVTSRR